MRIWRGTEYQFLSLAAGLREAVPQALELVKGSLICKYTLIVRILATSPTTSLPLDRPFCRFTCHSFLILSIFLGCRSTHLKAVDDDSCHWHIGLFGPSARFPACF